MLGASSKDCCLCGATVLQTKHHYRADEQLRRLEPRVERSKVFLIGSYKRWTGEPSPLVVATGRMRSTTWQSGRPGSDGWVVAQRPCSPLCIGSALLFEIDRSIRQRQRAPAGSKRYTACIGTAGHYGWLMSAPQRPSLPQTPGSAVLVRTDTAWV
jgi:hypothetical protein